MDNSDDPPRSVDPFGRRRRPAKPPSFGGDSTQTVTNTKYRLLNFEFTAAVLPAFFSPSDGDAMRRACV